VSEAVLRVSGDVPVAPHVFPPRLCNLPLTRCCLCVCDHLPSTRHQHNCVLLVRIRSNAMSEELVRRFASAVAGTVTNRLFADYRTFVYNSLFLHSPIRPVFAADLICLSARLASILLDALCMSTPRVSGLSCSVTRSARSINRGRARTRSAKRLVASPLAGIPNCFHLPPSFIASVCPNPPPPPHLAPFFQLFSLVSPVFGSLFRQPCAFQCNCDNISCCICVTGNKHQHVQLDT
jgi:hypothetical protein